jgi:signal transduction histidine kinase
VNATSARRVRLPERSTSSSIIGLPRFAAWRSLALRADDPVAPADALTASRYLLADFDGGLALIGSDATTLASAEWRWSGDDAPLADLLRNAKREPTYSKAFTEPGSGDYFMLVAAAGERSTIAVGAFSATALVRRTLTDAFVAGDQAGVFVVDANDQLLYQSGSLFPSGKLTEHVGVAQALRGESGATYIQTADSGEHVVAFSPIAPVGWALVVEERWERIDSPLLRTTQVAPLLLVPPLLLAVVALLFGIRQIVRPLQALEARAAELAWSRFQAIEQPVGGIAEIRRLQATLIHMAHKVKAAQVSLRDYISAITAGQEEERRRLARELHDDTLQSLIALNQRAQLTRLSVTEPSTVQAMTEIQALTEQTIANLRRVTRALRPIYLEDLGLVTALEMLAREASQTMNVPVECLRSGPERRLAPEVELALYRMAQEGLSNIARHAQASRATLSITFTPEAVSIIISDSGRGFHVPETPADFAPSGHFGLLGLYERAELIGAQFSIRSTPGQGTQLSIRLPAPPTAG